MFIHSLRRFHDNTSWYVVLDHKTNRINVLNLPLGPYDHDILNFFITSGLLKLFLSTISSFQCPRSLFFAVWSRPSETRGHLSLSWWRLYTNPDYGTTGSLVWRLITRTRWVWTSHPHLTLVFLTGFSSESNCVIIFQAYFEVADQSGTMSLVLWNELCPEFYQRLNVGTVLYLQNYTLKQSYSKRSHPQMDHHRMKTFNSVGTCRATVWVCYEKCVWIVCSTDARICGNYNLFQLHNSVAYTCK